MSVPVNYPSPTQQHASPYSGPFFGAANQHAHAPQNNTAVSGQEMPDDARLRSELTRQMQTPLMNQSPTLPRELEQDHDQLQAQQYSNVLVGPEDMRNQERHGSPNMSMGQETPGQKDRRSKVSRACDECRRKKARLLLV